MPGTPERGRMKTARISLVITTLAALLLQAQGASAAEVAAESMQSRVDAVIAEFGGLQTAPNEVTWDDGATVLDLAPSPDAPAPEAATPLARVALTVGGCAAGAHCIYSASNYAGDKVTFTGCSSNESVALLDGYVRSVANATANSTVRVFQGTSLLTRVAAGTGKNVSGAATRIACS